MGNQNSNQYEQINKSDYTFTYQLIRKANDRHYGEIKVVRDIKTGEQMYLREIVLTTKETYQNELNFYNKRISVSHPNVVKIYGCNGTDSQNFCSSYYKISVFIEMLPKTLEEELEARADSDIPFSENDILLIAENLISGLSYFETQGVFHGDIRPDNIFIATRSYKLSDPNLALLKDSNALSNAILGHAQTLPSPELLPQIPESDFVIRGNKFKADVFSLGITLLGLTSLTRSQDLYDYENGAFDWELLRERLELVRRTYSKFTYEMIRDMLKEEANRPDFISLSNRLMPYQEDIRNKEELPFFGIRAPFEEKREDEEENDISRYTYTEKANPLLQDFINSQLMQSTTRKGVIRNDKESGDDDFNPSEDFSTPMPNAFGYDNRDDISEDYEKPIIGSENYEDAQEYPPELQAQSSEKVRETYYEDFPRQQFVQQEAPLRSTIEQGPRYIPQHESLQYPETRVPTTKPTQISQVRNEPLHETSFPQYQPQTSQYKEPVTQAQPAYNPNTFQPTSVPQNQLHAQTQGFSESPILPATTGTQSQPQSNASQGGNVSDLDDLEAKIKAALERSEATYRKAYKPSYHSSPSKESAPTQKEEPQNYLQYPSDYASNNLSKPQPLYTSSNYAKLDTPDYFSNPINTSYSANLKPAEKNNSPQNQSELVTNAGSNENTFYDSVIPHNNSNVYGKIQNYSTLTYQSSQPLNPINTNYPQDYSAGTGYSSKIDVPSDWSALSGFKGLEKYGISNQNGHSSTANPDSALSYSQAGITNLEQKPLAQNLTSFS